ncbi:MAG: epoxyqueuosine reductase [Clostridia bacterium]|nr:epoxyqueuosine reductase [Clostridia bacterium]
MMDFDKLTRELYEEGVAAVGFADVSGALAERYAAFPRAVVLVWRLCDGVFDEVAQMRTPTFSYFQHYRAVNANLDRLTLRIATMLERDGARAMPVAASQSVHDNGPYAGIFPHKTAAVRAGLGWIGKSALFVSPEFGPRVRLATVLTDHPLVPEQVKREASVSRCGDCTRCRDACPAQAITGRHYGSGSVREDLFNPAACSNHMKKAYQLIGRGAVCGICASVCPYGQRRG